MHAFCGKWITDEEFAGLLPGDSFSTKEASTDRTDRHILFRKRFVLSKPFSRAKMYISADDYFKLYLNGKPVSMGPSPSYPSAYGYQELDVTAFLHEGENVIAVHTLYQGLRNRMWVSGDLRHGLITDLEIDGKTAVSSDESFFAQSHGGYEIAGVNGYFTSFTEHFDGRAPECRFAEPGFDDSGWKNASFRAHADWCLTKDLSRPLASEEIAPVSVREAVKERERSLVYDFGKMFVGYLCVKAKGKSGDTVRVLCGQELSEDGSVRFSLRCKCVYDEKWTLSGAEDALDWFDYKAFRYAELIVPEDTAILSVSLLSRHYPFELKTALRAEFSGDEKLESIWKMLVHSLKYGVQEQIHDCMERERGSYICDASYVALSHFLLTGDGSLARKLIEETFHTLPVSPTLGVCTGCSHLHEVAEYPLVFARLLWRTYVLTKDLETLRRDYARILPVMEGYRERYERGFLLGGMDKWSVVEWPKNYRDGYDVELLQHGTVSVPHLVLNAHYYETIKAMNRMAEALGLPPYRDAEPVRAKIVETMYDGQRHFFTDSVESSHVSYIGNVFALSYGLSPDSECTANVEAMIRTRKLHDVNIFGAFPILRYYAAKNDTEALRMLFHDEGAYLRMLSEGATATFEAWGKDEKWNTSLFHLTLSYGAVFLAESGKTLFCE